MATDDPHPLPITTPSTLSIPSAPGLLRDGSPNTVAMSDG